MVEFSHGFGEPGKVPNLEADFFVPGKRRKEYGYPVVDVSLMPFMDQLDT